jgi:hypothetical protein
MSVISAVRIQNQEDLEINASLGYGSKTLSEKTDKKSSKKA